MGKKPKGGNMKILLVIDKICILRSKTQTHDVLSIRGSTLFFCAHFDPPFELLNYQSRTLYSLVQPLCYYNQIYFCSLSCVLKLQLSYLTFVRRMYDKCMTYVRHLYCIEDECYWFLHFGFCLSFLCFLFFYYTNDIFVNNATTCK